MKWQYKGYKIAYKEYWHGNIYDPSPPKKEWFREFMAVKLVDEKVKYKINKTYKYSKDVDSQLKNFKNYIDYTINEYNYE